MDFIIWVIASLLGHTWRISVKDHYSVTIFNDLGKGRIYSFWHASLLPIAFIFRNTDKAAIISKSKDGQIAAAVARRWKYEILFGSSSRGGSTVLRASEEQLKMGRCIGITPDGPRGPRLRAKPGVAQIALRALAPVVVLKIHAPHCWRLNSWDRMIIPKPFSRVSVDVGKPIYPDTNTQITDESIEKFRRTIEESMRDNEPMA